MKIMKKKKEKTTECRALTNTDKGQLFRKKAELQLPTLIMQKKGLLIIAQRSKNKINYIIKCQWQKQ